MLSIPLVVPLEWPFGVLPEAHSLALFLCGWKEHIQRSQLGKRPLIFSAACSTMSDGSTELFRCFAVLKSAPLLAAVMFPTPSWQARPASLAV